MNHHYQTQHPYDSDSSENDSTVISSSDDNSSTDDTDSYSIQEYDLDVIDRVYLADQHFLDEPKIHGHYYLGTANGDGVLPRFMDISISPSTFFHFSYYEIVRYLRFYSIHWRPIKPTVDILQLIIINQEYQVIQKTYWLRLVQRHWRKIYQQQQRVWQIRKSSKNLRHRELYGHNLYGGNSLPRLQGMLSVYLQNSLDPNVDVMSPRQAELARTPLLQASLADRRTVALGDDAVNVVEASCDKAT